MFSTWRSGNQHNMAVRQMFITAEKHGHHSHHVYPSRYWGADTFDPMSEHTGRCWGAPRKHSVMPTSGERENFKLIHHSGCCCFTVIHCVTTGLQMFLISGDLHRLRLDACLVIPNWDFQIMGKSIKFF